MWNVEYKKRFLKELSKLPEDVQGQAEKTVFEKSPYGYIGYVEELPGANTQGDTLEEAKRNLIDAIQLVLEANREIAEEKISNVRPTGFCRRCRVFQ